MTDQFPSEVVDQLGHYVYRLIDPRNGETFYVGKGTGNRVFAHVTGEISIDGDAVSEKIKRIREIYAAGFKVAHVIHRHGLTSKVSYEVEAALIDAYPGVTNIAGGQHSGERGARHADEIINEWKAVDAEFKHRMLAIIINRTITEKSIYDAVRYAWKVNKKRAAKAEYVLAVCNGLIVGVFQPHQWYEATPEFFPETDEIWEGRRGFVGVTAPEDVSKLYMGKRLPAKFRKKGAANPVRYIGL